MFLSPFPSYHCQP
ncbi:hypothetical protein YPPY52_1433, partial [Yersinia pestis PY-52]